MTNYQHTEWSGKARDDRDPKEDIKQKDTDGPDCVRYLAMSNASYDSLRGLDQLAQPVEAYY